jgi:ABC-type transporter Mla subunit MlaD
MIGCGPNAEQQKMVADLTGEVSSMVNDATAALGNMDNVAGQITSALSGADSLAMKFPKDTTSIMGIANQLRSAKDRLMSVKDNVGDWLKAYKTPSLETMKFDEVVSVLKKSKDELTTAASEIQGAMGAASSALDGYKNLASGYMSKIAAKRK